jgi:hypothetical protein
MAPALTIFIGRVFREMQAEFWRQTIETASSMRITAWLRQQNAGSNLVDPFSSAPIP